MSRIDELLGNSLFTELSQEVEESLAGGGVVLSTVSAPLAAVSQLNVDQLVATGTCHAGLAVAGQLGFSVLPVGLV